MFIYSSNFDTYQSGIYGGTEASSIGTGEIGERISNTCGTKWVGAMHRRSAFVIIIHMIKDEIT